MGDVYIDPTKLRPLPRTVVPDIVDSSHVAAPSCFPALPWFIMLILISLMPFIFAYTMWKRHSDGTCDRPVSLYLIGQVLITSSYVVLIGLPMWRRINMIGSLKDTLAEYPEIRLYSVGTIIWWTELGWTMFGVRNAAEVSACSSNLRYSATTLAGYMMGLGVWLDLAFHIIIPAMLHMYSGQPAADILPPGAVIETNDALPKAPPKRKRPPPKRECPKCRFDDIAEELKMCPICGAFVPPLEAFIKKEKEDLAKEKEKEENKKKKFGGDKGDKEKV